MTQLTTPITFITTTVVDWVDVFTRPQYKNIVVDSLRYCQNEKGLIIYAWVLMSNHMHLIAGIDESKHCSDYTKYSQLLSGVIRDFKKITSKQIVSVIQDNPLESRKEWILDRFWFSGSNDKKITDFRFWQEGYYGEEIFTMKFLKQKIEYAHQNPVKQGIVSRAEDYIYSSAQDYAGRKGLLDVIVIN